MFGGTDLSELFKERPTRNLEMFDLKSLSDYGTTNDLFWWNDPVCIIGGITSQERHICLHNKPKGTQIHMAVCEEDSIYVIQAKLFAAHPDKNSENTVWRKSESTVSCLLNTRKNKSMHIAQVIIDYMNKFHFKQCCPDGHLYLDKTLTENGLKWNPNEEVVSLWIFHKDDINICPNLL